MSKLIDRISYFFSINLLKTLYINYRYFRWAGVRVLPIIVFRGVYLKSTGGQIKVEVPLKSRMIQIGAGGIGTIDFKYERTEWDVRGTIVVKGNVLIGRGGRISVGNEGLLTFDGNFDSSGRFSIICEKNIIFGNDVLLSWDILIMDSDFHFIYDNNGNIINGPKSIKIGDHVWVGCRSTILKGTTIPQNTVIAAGSLISSNQMDKSDAIYGGSGKHLDIIKGDIRWSSTAES